MSNPDPTRRKAGQIARGVDEDGVDRNLLVDASGALVTSGNGPIEAVLVPQKMGASDSATIPAGSYGYQFTILTGTGTIGGQALVAGQTIASSNTVASDIAVTTDAASSGFLAFETSP